LSTVRRRFWRRRVAPNVEYDRSVRPGTLRAALWLVVSSAGGFVAPPVAEASGPCAASPGTTREVGASPARPATDDLVIASLNIAGRAPVDELLAWVGERGVDVLLLQEVGHRSMDGAALAASLGDRLGFHSAYAPANVFGVMETQGLAIVSRHPLQDVEAYGLDYHRLRFRSRCRIALAATVATDDGPVQLVNVHLDTRINSSERVAQLAPVFEALEHGSGAQIIGGDFNTMNVRWFRTMWPFPFVQSQSTAVRRALGTAGFHTPFIDGPPTFRLLGFPLRLDWLFLKRLETLSWSVDAAPFTDHRGVWARLRPSRGQSSGRR
jgi:endonuclease/exonuclease/phosphatase family metal-dependent hydrolase